MSDSSWKRHERKTAAAFGTKRIGPVGKDGPDAQTETLAIECKYRAELPDWLTTPFRKIRVQARAGQIGIVVWHVKGTRRSADIVMIARSDFEDLFGQLPEAIDTTEDK